MKLFPIIVTVAVLIRNDADGAEGEAEFVHGAGRLPTEEEMPTILEKVMQSLPDGFRLMTRHESAFHYLRKHKGFHGSSNMVLPALDSGEEWHDPETASGVPPFEKHIDEEEGDELEY